MSSDQTTTPIPVSAGQRIAEEFGYDQVVIVARKVGVCEHVTTYGVDKAHCDVAARMGNFFKHKLMGWHTDPSDRFARAAEVMRLVDVVAASSRELQREQVGRGQRRAKSHLNDAMKAIEAAVRKLAGEAAS